MRCPVCRADNVAGPQCRRCRADLSLLFEVEDQRRRVLAQAAAAVQQGDGGRVSRLAEEAQSLRRDAESARLLAIGRLLQGDLAGAWQTYQALTGLNDEEP
jgi:hypothetical protein